MINLPKVTDLDVTNKKVLVRADLDIDIGENYRLEALLPTLKYLSSQSSKIILIGHRGRPEGKVVEELKMKPVEDELRKIASGIEFEVLENLRFDLGEEKNDLEYAKKLALLGDVYVNEAFASSHREAASITGLPKLLPHAAGLRFIEEVKNLSKVFNNPKRPVMFIVGGSKKDKLDYIEGLKAVADKILVGGRLPDYLQDRYSLPVRQAGILDTKIIVANLLPDKEDLTINSMVKFEEEIDKAGTIVLAGPMGKYEDEGHRQGTERIFSAVAASQASLKITGGGDSLSVLSIYDLKDKFDWVSVGGGAMLEFLAKRTLPGIKALESANLNMEG
ncbi:MAG: phosphoglycerate kinase, partial [Candidatus Woesebacteria bacterium]|nr:phosphoglycerate kinase [Candidatus Woesebacteria bacterium]